MNRQVGGAFGIEARYPFLDREFVQEVLWLTAEAKNAEYKAVLDEWFVQEGYPYKKRDKTGFSAAENRVISTRSQQFEMKQFFEVRGELSYIIFQQFVRRSVRGTSW